MKHAILLQVLARLLRAPTPLTVIDTHAGAGVYNLRGDAASKSGEAELGVARLMSYPNAPGAFAPLKAAVEARNAPVGGLSLYPGSPWLIVQALRPGDTYVGCELRSDDYGELAREIGRAAAAKDVRAVTLQRDGYEAATARLRGGGRLLLLIDPPFERGDEYDQVVATLACLKPRATADTFALVWLPLKDLETFDSFLRRLDALDLGPTAVAEVRLRPLANPMLMNGCALVMIGAPDLTAEANAICGWIASRLGAPGGLGRVCDLDGANLAKS